MDSNSDPGSKCLLCTKKVNFFSRSLCHLCDNCFCQSCTFTSSFLPKDPSSLLFSQKACKICALVWIIPLLKEEPLKSLPTKLLLVISQAYSLPSSSPIEKAELAQNIANSQFTTSTLKKYHENWQNVAKKISTWTNLLPQIENSVRNYSITQRPHQPSFPSNPPSSQSPYPNRDRETNHGGNQTFGSSSAPVFPDLNLNSIIDPVIELSNSLFEPTSVPEPRTSSQSRINNTHSAHSNHTPSPNFPRNTTASTPQPPENNYGSHTTNSYSNSRRPVQANNAQGEKLDKKKYKPGATSVSIQELASESEFEKVVSSQSASSLKKILNDNFVNCETDIEKSTLISKVILLVNSYKKENGYNQPNSSSIKPGLENHNLRPGFADEENLCKICYEEPANCVLLDCGHSIACVNCGKELVRLNQPCPICRSDICRIVRIFRG